MSDSSGVAGQSQSVIVDVPTTMVREASGDWLVTVTPDRSWLTDPARVYPVLLDPSLNISGTNIYTYENTGTVIADGQVRLGNSRAGGDTVWRTVACYPYSSLITNNDEIVGAQLNGTGNSGTATSYTGTVSYATAFAYNAIGTGLSNWTIGSSSGTAGDPALGAQYQTWINQSQAGACLMLQGQELASTYTYKNVSTSLYLPYQSAPVITEVSPVGGVMAAEMTKLTVSDTDPTGQPEAYSYEVSTNSNPDVSPLGSAARLGDI
jgi:hypothetical protein